MKRYEYYRETASPFLKEVPSHWEDTRIGRGYAEKSIGNNDGEQLLSVFLNRGVVSYTDTDMKQVHKPSEDMSSYQLVEPGDFVLNNQQAWRGSVGVSSYRGIVSPAYIVMTPIMDNNLRFMNYMLRETSCTAQFVLASKGVGSIQRILSPIKLKSSIMVLPPRAEQDQIVRYLDWQMSKINRLIAAKRKRIELVKEHFSVRIANIVCNGLKPSTPMRETGIDYIGAIPSHWTVLQNKRLFKSMNRTFQGIPTVLSLSQKDGLIPYSEMTERSLHTSSYENWQLVCPNDLVLNRFKAHLGVFFASKYTGIVTFHYGVYEAKMPLVAKYYEVLYHTPEYCRVYAGQSRGMTVGLQNLSDTNFYSTYTVYPPNEEQREIVTEIEQIEKQQSSIIAGVNRQIEKLQEFRTRLISDVVTGQVDVRGIEVPDFEYVGEADVAGEQDEGETEGEADG